MSTDDVRLPDQSGEPEDWREQGVCAQTDPEAFFPEKGGSTKEAKAMCADCEVKAECLNWALANNERFGIWGGLSERERRRLSKGLAAMESETLPTVEPRKALPTVGHRKELHAEIRRLLEEGLSNPVIAERTKVHIRTVERRRKVLLQEQGGRQAA